MADTVPVSNFLPAQTGIVFPTERKNILTAIEYQRRGYTLFPDHVRIFRNYARGIHKECLSTKQRIALQHLLGNRFCDNICKQIIFEARSRINFVKWACIDKTTEDFLKNLVITAKMLAKQKAATNGMLTAGNQLLAVNWDDKEKQVEVYREKWWDGIIGAFMGYDAIGRPLYVIKDWQESNGVWRRVIWFEDRIERYIGSTPQVMMPYNLPDDPVQGGQPVPWLDYDGTPLGIPFVHLPNGYCMEDDDYYGLSELDHGITGFQDQINGLQYGMSAGAEMTAYQMYWMSGVNPIDPITKKRNDPKVGAAEVWVSPSKDAAFGRIQAGDTKPVLEVFHEKITRVANVTATPLHRLLGKEWPSGEALMRAEQPAVNKADEQIARIDDPYRHLAYMAVKIRNRFGPDSPLPTDLNSALISNVFQDPEGRDPVSRSVVANNLANFASVEKIWRIMGADDEEVEKIVEERKQNIKDGIIADPGKTAGNGGGPNDKGSPPNPKEKKPGQKPTNIQGGN